MHIDFLSSDDRVCDDESIALPQHRCLWENCYRQFENKGDLRKHVRHHSGEKYCACPFCGRFFSRPDKLYEHLRKRAPIPVGSENQHSSETCAPLFQTDLIRHSAVHAPPKELCTTALKQPYLCHICESTYATGHGLTRHLSRKHECPIPEGFSRFSYKKCADGCYRLQTRKLEWASRHAEMTKLGLGGDYEWISAVQKKFIGGGLASAIDVDAAVCVAEHKDQVWSSKGYVIKFPSLKPRESCNEIHIHLFSKFRLCPFCNILLSLQSSSSPQR
ncbi:zinc finger, C2H2 type [Teladorsagia circumcincta]|uniref:Zinc finger, C2H2 type n=1 Tax=Teladorsagia circumcincta TaxID=45464 RepID=A0A2G9TWC4_TELCI|nr:zinc finger, C2H2 type [Teladorsagia circumcincta]